MAKTRAQTRDLGIKKEEEEEDCKPTLLLNRVDNTRNNNKITKRKPSKRNNRRLPAQQVKVEEDTDIKPLLQPSQESSKLPKRHRVSQEQINQVIDYVANHGMSVTKAARKANISKTTAQYYYNDYKDDLDKRIPSPRNRPTCAKIYYTQEQIKNVIKYINNDKLNIKEASEKANMPCRTGRYYYRKYLNNPDINTPIRFLNRGFTQDQKRELIRYIVNDKMSITQASKKAKVNLGTGKCYCREYFKNQRPDIPTPSHIVPYRERYTQEQIKEVISYIVSDNMTIRAASRKANMYRSTVVKYYHQYLKDNNMEIPVSKYATRYTQHQKNAVIGYIVEDKMSITAASKKANITASAGHNYYHKYLKENNIEARTRRYTQEQINEVIGYIVDDKMSITAASKRANMSHSTGSRYYRQYLNNRKLDAADLS